LLHYWTCDGEYRGRRRIELNKKYRKTIIAGNWKMNKTPAEARALVDELKAKIARCKWAEVVLCVPYVDIPIAVKSARDSKILIGAQNIHQELEGAYTGEISGKMLRELGVKFVIIGHSERRQYFHETDELVATKIVTALNAGLRVILCVGESLDQRDRNLTLAVIELQILAALSAVEKADDLKKITIAYEPIWAIGTGRTATVDQAAEVCTFIRTLLRKEYGARIGRSVSILYGGSMNAGNAKDLLAKDDIDGGLIGGASLKAADFAAIVNAANQ
jgi:triosephosphate isomerase